ncbi:MAG: SpoIID/LytB domain-containing protein [Mycobacteriales bacterium]
MPHRRAALALASVVGGLLVGVTATPARANITVNEVYPVPSSGVYPIEGHGWGHGHGLSQYGAQGGAQLGKTADQITAFYYPSTAKGSLANVTMRVRLLADNDVDTQVYPATGLTVTDLSSGAKAALTTSGVTRYRSVTDGYGLHLQQYLSGAWRSVALGGKTTTAGPLQFSGPTFVRLALPDGTSRDYRGALRSVRTGGSTVASVDVLPMESYLLGVVPRESSSSWAAAALQAQAIAARTYSEYKREHAPSSQFYDICDTTMCQVFGGSSVYDKYGNKTALEPSSTTQAVQATSGVIRTYQGQAVFSEFSASNGGWSTDGGMPYLIAQQDDWDGVTGSSVHSWTATVSAAQIEARYPAVGRLLRMRVTQRDGNGDWGGRVKQVVLEGVDSSGQATSVTTTGAGIYNAHTWPGSTDGLRSSWWHVTPATNSALVSQSTAPRLVQTPGVSTGTLTATLKNTGTTTWSTNGLHLAVASPPGQADPLVGGSTRPGVYAGSATSIAPGDTASFRFSLTGDGVDPGLQGRSYRLRIGTGALFGATVSWRIEVDAPVFTGSLASGPTSAAAQPAAGSAAPGPVLADGRTVVVPVSGSTPLTLGIRNSGNVSWPVGSGSPVRLGTSNPRGTASPSAGSDWLSTSRPSTVSGSAAVAPGQTGSFGLTLHGNGKPVGVTQESFEPLWEGRHWIDGALTALTLVRVDPSVSRVATLDTAPTSKLTLTTAPNGTAVLHVRLRNTGGSRWDVGSEGLASNGFALATSAWSSSSRPPKLSLNVTRPNVTAVYPGEVGEWQVPISAYRKSAGSYTLKLRPLAPNGVAYGPQVSTTVTVVTADFSGSLYRTSGTVQVPHAGGAFVYFDVKNTGNVAWPVHGPLRSEALYPGGSPSRASSWISASRPGTLTNNLSNSRSPNVLPGQVARFAFVVAGNGRTPGTRSETFDAVWETWARIAGVKATLSYTIV